MITINKKTLQPVTNETVNIPTAAELYKILIESYPDFQTIFPLQALFVKHLEAISSFSKKPTESLEKFLYWCYFNGDLEDYSKLYAQCLVSQNLRREILEG